MPKSGKKKDSCGNNSAIDINTADITLNDFANTKITGRRLKKPASNCFSRTEKNKECKSVMMMMKKSEDHPGYDYPLDLWFLLGDYIKPEDVHIFASICRKSLYVVRTYKFWLCLYRRYYKDSQGVLPDNLKPVHIQRPHLIKFNVVRALYHFYPPFLERKKPHPSDTDIRSLVQLRCSNLWHVKDSANKWLFYFKFQEKIKKTKNNHQDSLNCVAVNNCENWEDDSYDSGHPWQGIIGNPEDGCHTLCIGSQNFLALSPKIMGHRLADVRVSLSGDLRGHKVHLTFAPNSYQCGSPLRQCPRTRSGKGDALLYVEVDPIDSIQVARWWHKHYPINYS